MKTFLTICALAAGAGLMATSNTASADHCHRGFGGYGGGFYSGPSYGYYPSYGYGRRGFNDYGYYNRGFNRGYGYNRGFNRGYGYRGRSGFSLQTRDFGIYIR